MLRRRFFGILLAYTRAETRAVTDEQKLNAFAREYNDYVARLRTGIIDVKRWARVVEAWKRLTA